MKNQAVVTRLEAELNQWRSREERFNKLFPFSLSSNPALLREKLRYYERIIARYRSTNDPDERFALQVLRQERNRMEKQLYPGFLIRVLRRLLVSPVKDRIIIRRDTKNMEKNSRSLQEQLQRAGFTGLSSKLDEHIRQGEQQFFITVSYYTNEKERLDHQLDFFKDRKGNYQFPGFTTKLHNETKPEESRQQQFNLQDDVETNVHRAVQLLKGRSVWRKDKWIQLDLNDKDAQGNYRVKEFHAFYGFDLEKTLEALPLKELKQKAATDNLLYDLKQGNREEVSFIKDGKEQRYYIEANPQLRTVNIYDEHSRKISLSAALGNKTMEAVGLTRNLNDRQRESQAKRNGMRIS